MNKLQLIGRPTDDPECTVHTVSRNNNDVEMVVAKFNFAVNRRGTRDVADFFQCVAFGKTADFIKKYVKKGNQIYLEGSMRNNNYIDKDGRKIYGFQFHLSEIELLGKKGDTGQTETENGYRDIPEGEEPFNGDT